MRTYIVLIVLLVIAHLAFAEHSSHSVKRVEARALTVYLLDDSHAKLCQSTADCMQVIEANQWADFCAQDCIEGLSWQSYLSALLALYNDKTLELHIIDNTQQLLSMREQLQCQQQSILFWPADHSAYWQQRDHLLQLAQHNVQSIIISTAEDTLLPISEHRLYAQLGFTPLELNMSESINMLSQQLMHILQRTDHASQFNLAPIQISGVLQSGNDLVLQAVKPMANQRWVADVYSLSLSDTSQLTTLDTLMIRADGELERSIEQLMPFSLSKSQMRQYQQSWLDSINIKNNQFNQALRNFLGLSNLPELKDSLARYLQGENLYNQPLAFSLLDSPNSAMLLLDNQQTNEVLYTSSDGVFHHWQIEAPVQQWHSNFFPLAADFMLQDYWDLGSRKQRYTGQLSAVYQQQSRETKVFYGAGEAEKAIYHWSWQDSDKPSLRWRITAQGDFNELANIEQKSLGVEVNTQGRSQLAILTGAGFDPAYTNSKTKLSRAEMGNAIYLIDTESAALIWKASFGESNHHGDIYVTNKNMKHAFAATASLNQPRDQAFFADMGGQLWHLSMPQCQGEQCLALQFKPQYWQFRKIAKTNKLQSGFYYPVALHTQADKYYLAAVTGSAMQSQFDDSTLFFFALDKSMLDLDELSPLASCELADCNKGWKFSLAQSERPYSELVVQNGFLYLITYQEQPQSCHFISDKYRLYRFDLRSSKPDFVSFDLADGSLFKQLNKNNADFLLPLIERYIEGERDSISIKEALENINTETAAGDIVISSWREYFY